MPPLGGTAIGELIPMRVFKILEPSEETLPDHFRRRKPNESRRHPSVAHDIAYQRVKDSLTVKPEPEFAFYWSVRAEILMRATPQARRNGGF